MRISCQQAAEILGVSKWTVARHDEVWGLKIIHTKGGYKKYDLEDVVNLAKKWAAEKEQEAAVIRQRVRVEASLKFNVQ